MWLGRLGSTGIFTQELRGEIDKRVVRDSGIEIFNLLNLNKHTDLGWWVARTRTPPP